MAFKQTTIYIISSKKKGTVWKEPFATREEAERELASQLNQLPLAQRALADWRIESRSIMVPLKAQAVTLSPSPWTPEPARSYRD